MESLCRGCLIVLPSNSNSNNCNLSLDQELAIRFVECTQLSLDTLDNYPKCVCSNCYEMILKFYDFRKMCSESMWNFKCFLEEQFAIVRAEMNHSYGKETKDEINQQETLSFNADESNVVKRIHVMREIKTKSEELNIEPVVRIFEDERKTSRANEVNLVRQKLTDRTVARKSKMKVFYCSDCPKKWFYTEDRLKAHLRTHLGLKPYMCKICSKQFTRSDALNVHMKERHDEMKLFHYCSYKSCVKVYSSLRSLHQHFNKVHKLKATVPKDKQICEICGKSFATKVFLKRHHYIHLEKSQYPFECEHCGKRFYSKQFLRDHLNRHAGVELFYCPKCGLGKPTKAEVKKHMQYHLAETSQPYKCCICDRGFSQKRALNVHKYRSHYTRKSEKTPKN